MPASTAPARNLNLNKKTAVRPLAFKAFHDTAISQSLRARKQMATITLYGPTECAKRSAAPPGTACEITCMVCTTSVPSIPWPQHSSHHIFPQSPCNPSWGPPRGLLIPPARGPRLRTGRPLGAIFAPEQPRFEMFVFWARPASLRGLSGSPLGRFWGPPGALLG